MGNMIFKSGLLCVTGIASIVSAAFATPVWNANPILFSSELIAAEDAGYYNPKLPTSSGYYIWANNSSRTSWSVRWTGNNDNDKTGESWFGSVAFLDVNNE